MITITAITSSRWMSPPATWNARNPSAHRMMRITASVHSMSGSPRVDVGAGPFTFTAGEMHLAAEQNSRGTYVMTHVDHENGEITHTPERAREHDQAAR